MHLFLLSALPGRCIPTIVPEDENIRFAKHVHLLIFLEHWTVHTVQKLSN
jgi:hypothetical protein